MAFSHGVDDVGAKAKYGCGENGEAPVDARLVILVMAVRIGRVGFSHETLEKRAVAWREGEADEGRAMMGVGVGMFGPCL